MARVGDKAFRTQTIENTLNPEWKEEMVFPVAGNERFLDLEVSVWDEDSAMEQLLDKLRRFKKPGGDDFLGQYIRPLRSFETESQDEVRRGAAAAAGACMRRSGRR